ncbi:OsmC family protein [Olivibacter sp. SDN3]|uniref:OsmC family protein n=1 Tax=Olivibacter sp. SDN3 TaxID=2764720 RepID=UPI001C9E869D|nr:OsmC family protein [Olivibacter sp. SDN3]
MLFVLAFYANTNSFAQQQNMPPVIKSEFYGKGKSAIVAPNKEPFIADMENFRPIDFLIGGYGTCMMGTMDNIAGKNGFNLSEARTEISTDYDSDKGRIAKIHIKCFIKKGDYTAEQKQILEDAAKQCPIGNSLHPDIEKNIKFLYGVE